MDQLEFMRGWAARIANQFGHDLGDWKAVNSDGIKAVCKKCGDSVTVYASGASSGKAVQQYCKAGRE